MQAGSLREGLIADYWRQKLQAADQPVKNGRSGIRESVSGHIGSDELSALMTLTNGDERGKFIVLLTAYCVLLKRYFGYSELLVCGADPVLDAAERNDELVVFYSYRSDGMVTLREAIGYVKDEAGRVLNHRELDFPAFRAGFEQDGIREDMIRQFGFGYSGLNGASAYVEGAGFHFYIGKEDGGGLSLRLDFDAYLYDPLIATQFISHYSYLVKRIRENLGVNCERIDYVSEEEKDIILNKFNTKPAGDQPYKGILTLLKEKEMANPEATALVAGENRYSYAELGRLTDQLATYLIRDCAVEEDQLVGLVAGRSEWFVIGMLAILKSGGAFVPIEAAQPQERIRHIAGDAGIGVLLVESEAMFDFDWFTGKLVVTDIQAGGFDYAEVVTRPRDRPEDLAYVIYTSGTTGGPKGVMINCGSVVNYSQWLISEFGIGVWDSTAILSSLAFDLGYTGLWGSLLAGGTLYLPGFDCGAEPDRVVQYLAKHRISFIKTTPSLFYMLTHVPSFKKPDAELRLRLIILGGELIRKEDILSYRSLYPRTRFVNHYGPTEATIGCIANPIVDGSGVIDPYTLSPVIGKPVRGCEVLILEENGALTPIGLEGEICVGGAGLARGYLNNTVMTETKFIAHPYRDGERLYKTGDYGRWTKKGAVIIHGRKDNQIKIRGHRVELGEIEQVLLRYNGIGQAVVLAEAKSNGDKAVVAYYRVDRPIGVAEMRAYLGERLPVHMIPEGLIQVEDVPLTANGKVDRKRLPSPWGVEAGFDLLCKGPENEVEELILGIWREVLGKRGIGVEDNFFDIGGNSLYMVKVSSLLAERYPDITIVDLFNYTTVRKLAEYIDAGQPVRGLVIEGGLCTLPEGYFSGNGTGQESSGQTVLRFRIDGELLRELVKMADVEGVRVDDVLAAAYAYCLAGISGKAYVGFHRSVRDRDSPGLRTIELDLEAIGDMGELCRQIGGRGSGDGEGLVAAEKLGLVRFADGTALTVAPVIYTKKDLGGTGLLSGVFDMIMEIDDADAEYIECLFEYGARLDPSSMEGFVGIYTTTLSSLINAEAV